MKRNFTIYGCFIITMLLLLVAGSQNASAQIAKKRRMGIKNDTVSVYKNSADSIAQSNQKNLENINSKVDTLALIKQNDSINKAVIPNKIFVPDSRKSLWLALVIPGGGQIYNRKYWKLPLVYGGFMGCAYAFSWNNNMYKDYSQAYLDIMDDDPNTSSFKDFLPPGYDITGQEERFKNLFKTRKDLYRRQRDLSIFAFIGVYLLSVIDAYVDAELSDFDISKDISLKVQPAFLNNTPNRRTDNAVGLQCSLKF